MWTFIVYVCVSLERVFKLFYLKPETIRNLLPAPSRIEYRFLHSNSSITIHKKSTKVHFFWRKVPFLYFLLICLFCDKKWTYFILKFLFNYTCIFQSRLWDFLDFKSTLSHSSGILTLLTSFSWWFKKSFTLL